MNPLQQTLKPPSYEEYTVAPGPPDVVTIEENGLTSNQILKRSSQERESSLSKLVGHKLWSQLLAAWVLWLLVTFVLACVALGRANVAIQNDKGDTITRNVVEQTRWADRCEDIGTALYGDDAVVFEGHTYQIVGGDFARLSWRLAATDAWERCLNGVPGYLAAINSEAENDFILAQLFANSNYKPENNNRAWIGGTDMQNEGKFQWIDGQGGYTTFYEVPNNPGVQNHDYTNFAYGEPNQRGSEDCLSMYLDGKWNDDNCYNNLQFFIVEFDTDGGSNL